MHEYHLCVLLSASLLEVGLASGSIYSKGMMPGSVIELRPGSVSKVRPGSGFVSEARVGFGSVLRQGLGPNMYHG